MLDKKSKEEIKILRQGGKILHNILHTVAKKVDIGITGIELNNLAEEMIKKAGGKPAFKNYKGYPAGLCVSINQTVVHGIPNNTPFKKAIVEVAQEIADDFDIVCIVNREVEGEKVQMVIESQVPLLYASLEKGNLNVIIYDPNFSTYLNSLRLYAHQNNLKTLF